MTEVSIKITAKVGAASFEIESSPGDELHHITGPDFMKRLMDLAGYVAPPDADVPAPVVEVQPVSRPAVTEPADEARSESSMGSVDEFLNKGGRVTPLDGGRVMEEEPIFTPGSDVADKAVKTFGDRVKYDDTPEGRKRKEAMERINDADGWGKT